MLNLRTSQDLLDYVNNAMSPKKAIEQVNEPPLIVVQEVADAEIVERKDMKEIAMDVDEDDLYWAAPNDSIEVESDDDYRAKLAAQAEDDNASMASELLTRVKSVFQSTDSTASQTASKMLTHRLMHSGDSKMTMGSLNLKIKQMH